MNKQRFTGFCLHSFLPLVVLVVHTHAGVAGQANADTRVPEIITDAALLPKSFHEAPMLGALVKQGKLPPVEQRLPQEPEVIRPTHKIGRYGGTLRRGFTGPADGQNIDRIQHNHLLFWDTTVTTVTPHIAKSWEVSHGGKTFTFFLRKGMKWSDGQPFTADDFIFWYKDIYLNDQLNPTKARWNEIGGEQGVWEKVDQYAFRVKFVKPYYMFLEELASLGVAGHFTRGGRAMGLFAPKHYLKQFHPKYVGLTQVNKLAKQQGYDSWAQLFKFKNSPKLNIDCPVTTPWVVTNPLNTTQLVLERNPYYFGVDTVGNQLPYIDRIVMTLAQNLEVLNLWAIAGEYDFQSRHIDLAKVPVFIENQPKGNYTVRFWRGLHGTDAGLFFNQTYEADPEIAKWLRNKDFRIALSMGIDRDQLNEIFWLGLGDPGSAVPSPASQYSPGQKYRKLHSEFDPDQANQILNRLGLDGKDGDGFRIRTDGKGRLVFKLATIGAAFLNWTGIAEMVVEQWAQHIGIKARVQEMERSLYSVLSRNNDLQISVFSNDGSDNPFTYPFHVMACHGANGMAPLHGRWWESGGTQGIKPEGDLLRQLELFERAKGLPFEQRTELGQEILRLLGENVWVIGTVGVSPAFMGVVIVSNEMGNVPEVVPFSSPAQTPGNARPEQFYFKQ